MQVSYEVPEKKMILHGPYEEGGLITLAHQLHFGPSSWGSRHIAESILDPISLISSLNTPTIHDNLFDFIGQWDFIICDVMFICI